MELNVCSQHFVWQRDHVSRSSAMGLAVKLVDKIHDVKKTKLFSTGVLWLLPVSRVGSHLIFYFFQKHLLHYGTFSEPFSWSAFRSAA